MSYCDQVPTIGYVPLPYIKYLYTVMRNIITYDYDYDNDYDYVQIMITITITYKLCIIITYNFKYIVLYLHIKLSPWVLIVDRFVMDFSMKDIM